MKNRKKRVPHLSLFSELSGRPDKNAVILGTPGKGRGIQINLINEIDPEIFCKYLQDSGWKQFPRKRKDIKVFQMERGDEIFQATIPLDRNLGDYEEAMKMAVKEVSVYKGVTEGEILSFLIRTSFAGDVNVNCEEKGSAKK